MSTPKSGRLFEAADLNIAGLPDRLINARAGVRRIEAILNALPPPPDTPQDRLAVIAANLVEAAIRGEVDQSYLLVDSVNDQRQWCEEHHDRAQLVAQALDRAREHLEHTVRSCVDEVFAEHLAPAIAVTVEKLRKAHATYSAHGASERELLGAPAAARTAWLNADTAVHEYEVLRSVRAAFLRAVGQEGGNDPHGLFAHVSNPATLWPELLTNPHVLHAGAKCPWDDPDPRRRLLNLLHGGGEFWCPTAEQQEAAWQAVFGQRIEDDRQNRLALRQNMQALGMG